MSIRTKPYTLVFIAVLILHLSIGFLLIFSGLPAILIYRVSIRVCLNFVAAALSILVQIVADSSITIVFFSPVTILLATHNRTPLTRFILKIILHDSIAIIFRTSISCSTSRIERRFHYYSRHLLFSFFSVAFKLSHLSIFAPVIDGLKF